MKTPLTAAQILRTNTEITRIEKKLIKEIAYSKDLQDKTKISYLEENITRLNEIITNGWNAPKFN